MFKYVLFYYFESMLLQKLKYIFLKKYFIASTFFSSLENLFFSNIMEWMINSIKIWEIGLNINSKEKVIHNQALDIIKSRKRVVNGTSVGC